MIASLLSLSMWNYSTKKNYRSLLPLSFFSSHSFFFLVLVRFISHQECGAELRMYRFLLELRQKKQIKRNILTFSLRAYFLLASSMRLTKKIRLGKLKIFSIKKVILNNTFLHFSFRKKKGVWHLL